MTIMAHPSKTDIQRYRVLDKALGVQEYFSVSKYGKEGAYQKALERQHQLDERRQYREMIENMAINKLFDKQGMIKGVRLLTRKRSGRNAYSCFKIQVTVAKRQCKSTEISLKNRGFEDAYQLMSDKLLEYHEIETTPEIRIMFKNAKHEYERIAWQLAEDERKQKS